MFCRGRRALFQELVESGSRHRFDVVGFEPLLGDRQALPSSAAAPTARPPSTSDGTARTMIVQDKCNIE
jgi:hypothetical protein